MTHYSRRDRRNRAERREAMLELFESAAPMLKDGLSYAEATSRLGVDRRSVRSAVATWERATGRRFKDLKTEAAADRLVEWFRSGRKGKPPVEFSAKRQNFVAGAVACFVRGLLLPPDYEVVYPPETVVKAYRYAEAFLHPEERVRMKQVIELRAAQHRARMAKDKRKWIQVHGEGHDADEYQTL